MIFLKEKPTHFLYFGINSLLFCTLYFSANSYSQYREMLSCAFAFEGGIPFINWMIVPYLSINILFLLPLFALNAQQAKRLGIGFALCTVFAAICFFMMPCKSMFSRNVSKGIFESFYNGLYSLDYPYNNVPSLHVAYTVLIGLALLNTVDNGWLKIFLLTWIMTIIASTIFTHQHHLLDVITGALLGALVGYVMKVYDINSLHKNDFKTSLLSTRGKNS